MHWAIRTKAQHSICQSSGSSCKAMHWKLLEAQSTLVNPTGILREPREPGHRTTSSSPLLAFPHTFQLLIFSIFLFFSSSFAPSTIYLGDGTLTSLTSSVSNLPLISTGQALLLSFYKWGNWGSEKVHLNCLLDHSDPSCYNHTFGAMLPTNMSFQNTVSNSVQEEESLTCRFWSYPARCLRSQSQTFLQWRWSGLSFQHSRPPPGETTALMILQWWDKTLDRTQSPLGKGAKASSSGSIRANSQEAPGQDDQ